MEMDRTGGWGCVQSVTTIKAGAKRHRGERERERGVRDKPVNFSSVARRNHSVQCP